MNERQARIILGLINDNYTRIDVLNRQREIRTQLFDLSAVAESEEEKQIHSNALKELEAAVNLLLSSKLIRVDHSITEKKQQNSVANTSLESSRIDAATSNSSDQPLREIMNSPTEAVSTNQMDVLVESLAGKQRSILNRVIRKLFWGLLLLGLALGVYVLFFRDPQYVRELKKYLKSQDRVSWDLYQKYLPTDYEGPWVMRNEKYRYNIFTVDSYKFLRLYQVSKGQEQYALAELDIKGRAKDVFIGVDYPYSVKKTVIGYSDSSGNNWRWAENDNFEKLNLLLEKVNKTFGRVVVEDAQICIHSNIGNSKCGEFSFGNWDLLLKEKNVFYASGESFYSANADSIKFETAKSSLEKNNAVFHKRHGSFE